ncbi:MAG: hypothetical protein PF574_02890 [Candidatus Delongbacteria bacterium]|jgi:hypothetical protein|nr:hypothetical protein [Candidatus Delongbacteria bacterium]
MIKSSDRFFYWAYKTRADIVHRLLEKEDISKEKVFLSFCSHTPAFVSNGPSGLNASIKGIGFIPKFEFLEETLEVYLKHINSYDADDKDYSKRGLAILAKYLYAPEKLHQIDFTRFGTLELAKKHTWNNYRSNPEATVIFLQPPTISYELRGNIEIHDEITSGKKEIYQQFINAQHDVYHGANKDSWLEKPAYIFNIEEVWDKSATDEGFGNQLLFP